jgi:hypothetical protein
MKQIADLVRRLWQSQPAPHFQTPITADKRDRSSMADFVRILQAYDRDRQGRINRGSTTSAPAIA